MTIPAALLIGGGIAAGSQLLGGALSRRAGKQAAEDLLSEDERKRLRELQQMQQAGQLGMTEEQRAAFDAQVRAAQAGAAREAQAESLARQAAAPTSGRDVFLERLALEQSRQEGITAENLARQQAEALAAQQQAAELAALQNQRAAAAQLARLWSPECLMILTADLHATAAALPWPLRNIPPFRKDAYQLILLNHFETKFLFQGVS